MSTNEEVIQLKKEVETLQKQIGTLMDIFGFAGYAKGFITDDDSEICITTNGYKKLNHSKLPIHKQDFDLLLKHLGVTIENEKIERKVVKLKAK